MGDRVFDIFKREVKVATYAKSKLFTDLVVELADEVPNLIAAIRIGVISVGSGDYVRNAVLDCHMTHLECHVPGFGAVIEAGKDMAVDVDHQRVLVFDCPIEQCLKLRKLG